MNMIFDDQVVDSEDTLERQEEEWRLLYDINVIQNRKTDIRLPETVTILEKQCGSKVYLIGTAHFSEDSIADVVRIMDQTIPDCVILELCEMRSRMLLMDEETLKKEMLTANLMNLMKKEGQVAGLMHFLMLRMSNHVMEQMKMLPGGEFRAAYQKSREFPFCSVTLADRRIDITLKRALASLGLGGRLKFFMALLLGLKPISKEEIENMKKADILEQLLKELGSEFPSLAKVMVDERDLFLTKSIWDSVKPVDREGQIPSVNVAVVGIGHCAGIARCWAEAEAVDQLQLCEIPKPPLSWTLFLNVTKLLFVPLVAFSCYKVCHSVFRRF